MRDVGVGRGLVGDGVVAHISAAVAAAERDRLAGAHVFGVKQARCRDTQAVAADHAGKRGARGGDGGTARAVVFAADYRNARHRSGLGGDGGAAGAMRGQVVVARLVACQCQATVGHGAGSGHILGVVQALRRAANVDRITRVGLAVAGVAGGGHFGGCQGRGATHHRRAGAVVDFAGGHGEPADAQGLGRNRCAVRALHSQGVVTGLPTGKRKAAISHRAGCADVFAVVGACGGSADAHHITGIGLAVGCSACAHGLTGQGGCAAHHGCGGGVIDLAGRHRQAAHGQGLGGDRAGRVADVADSVVGRHVRIGCVFDGHGAGVHGLGTCTHVLVGVGQSGRCVDAVSRSQGTHVGAAGGIALG